MEEQKFNYVLASELIKPDKEMYQFFDYVLSVILGKNNQSPDFTLIKNKFSKFVGQSGDSKNILNNKKFGDFVKLMKKIEKADTEDQIFELLLTASYNNKDKLVLEEYIRSFIFDFGNKYSFEPLIGKRTIEDYLLEHNKKFFLIKAKFDILQTLSKSQKTEILQNKFKDLKYNPGSKIFRIQKSETEGRLFDILYEATSPHDEIQKMKSVASQVVGVINRILSEPEVQPEQKIVAPILEKKEEPEVTTEPQIIETMVISQTEPEIVLEKKTEPVEIIHENSPDSEPQTTESIIDIQPIVEDDQPIIQVKKPISNIEKTTCMTEYLQNKIDNYDSSQVEDFFGTFKRCKDILPSDFVERYRKDMANLVKERFTQAGIYDLIDFVNYVKDKLPAKNYVCYLLYGDRNSSVYVGDYPKLGEIVGWDIYENIKARFAKESITSTIHLLKYGPNRIESLIGKKTLAMVLGFKDNCMSREKLMSLAAKLGRNFARDLATDIKARKSEERITDIIKSYKIVNIHGFLRDYRSEIEKELGFDIMEIMAGELSVRLENLGVEDEQTFRRFWRKAMFDKKSFQLIEISLVTGVPIDWDVNVGELCKTLQEMKIF